MSAQPISTEKKLAEYAELVARDGEVCAWCGRGPGEIDLTIDHVDPDGGESLDNKQLLCRPCNSQKGEATEDKTVRWVNALFQHGFTMVPNLVVASDVLDVYAHRLYELLLYYARQEESCWPGQEGLARLMKCSEKQVRNATRALEGVGLVRTRRRGRGQTNVYVLLVPRAARGSGLGSREVPGAGLDRNVVPPTKKQGKKTNITTAGADASLPGFEVAAEVEVPKEVSGDEVTPAEAQMARAILATYNRVFGKDYRSATAVTSIVCRIRERPDLTLQGHADVIEKFARQSWWRTDRRTKRAVTSPPPRLLYGSDKAFDFALNADEEEAVPDMSAYVR